MSQLPSEPLFVLESRPVEGFGVLSDVWEYRELLYFLTWRDIKVRYKQTILGVAWAVIQPLVAMIIFTLFFGKLARVPSDGIPYPAFAFAGLIAWTFFSNAVTTGGNSLISSANLISKIYFPRVLVPASAVAAGLVDLAIAFAVLVLLMVYYGITPGPRALLLLPLTAMLVLLAVAVSLGMSALNVKYRDVRYALPFVIQLWMFATPIIYPSSLVPEQWRWVLALNPLAGVVDGFRASLFGLPMDWGGLGLSALTTLVVLVVSSMAFFRMERSFADIV